MGIAQETQRDIYYVEISVTADSVIVESDWKPFRTTNADESVPDIHPSGDYLLYQINNSGTYQIEVRSFPDSDDNLWQITVDGGYRPRWHPSGESIYYMKADNTLWRVNFNPSARSPIGEPEYLFQFTGTGPSPYWIPYDIGPITGRIAATQPIQVPAPPRITFVENWMAAFE